MTHTSFAGAQSPGSTATGYSKRDPISNGRVVMPWRQAYCLSPAVGMVSNIHDLSRFASLFTQGPMHDVPGFVKRSTLQDLVRPSWQSGCEAGHTMGFFRRCINGQVRLRHDGLTEGYATQIDLEQENQQAVIALVNATDAQPWRLTNTALALLNGVKVDKVSVDMQSLAQAYAGKYQCNGFSRRIIMAGKLMLVDMDADDIWGERTVLEPVSKHTYRMTSGAWQGEALRFEVGADGRARRFSIDGVGFSRTL